MSSNFKLPRQLKKIPALVSQDRAIRLDRCFFQSIGRELISLNKPPYPCRTTLPSIMAHVGKVQGLLMHSGQCKDAAVLLDDVLDRVKSKKPLSAQERQNMATALRLAQKVIHVAHAATKVDAAGIGGGEASYVQKRLASENERTHPTGSVKAALEQYVEEYSKPDSMRQQPAKKGKVKQVETHFDHLAPRDDGCLFYTPLQAMQLLAAEEKKAALLHHLVEAKLVSARKTRLYELYKDYMLNQSDVKWTTMQWKSPGNQPAATCLELQAIVERRTAHGFTINPEQITYELQELAKKKRAADGLAEAGEKRSKQAINKESARYFALAAARERIVTTAVYKKC
jgi:hypothetical protein